MLKYRQKVLTFYSRSKIEILALRVRRRKYSRLKREEEKMIWVIAIIVIVMVVCVSISKEEERKKQEEERRRQEAEFRALKSEILRTLGFKNWNLIPRTDTSVTVKSRSALEKFDDIKYFKENREDLEKAELIVKQKKERADILNKFLEKNEYENRPRYNQIKAVIVNSMRNAGAFRIEVNYISSAGNKLGTREIAVSQARINKLKNEPDLLMSKTEYNKFLREQQKATLDAKHRDYYDRVNSIIDYANENRDFLILKGSRDEMDSLITQLFDRTVNSIKKIKTIDSEEWDVIGSFISRIKEDIEQLVDKNHRVSEYYESQDFQKIKDTCESLMSSQKEFNEYINEKVQSISKLFGTRVTRTETTNEDVNNYIRPYKKTITPFTAEVSAAVFASAENNPLDYVVKSFYPDRNSYPEQIQKLYLLVEELETLKDAKQIIENYKADYQQYLGDVPEFIMENDEAGFYSRLGFANIDEEALTVEYKFSYTSGGGMAQRTFTVPMTEETIVELIKTLEGKLTASAFAKEQRNLMTRKLREFIKERDHYTCCTCGNSTEKEPNLLLEIDHIIPVSKGGCTVEDNLQTLCWKCNRAKSDKIIS